MISDLLQIALRDPAVYDEFLVEGATPRKHWEPFVEQFSRISPEEFTRRLARAERRIRENGVTYNIYDDPAGANRPWRLDLIPLLIDAAEWRTIEAGVIQRAELLRLILQDLYGPQTLLTSGALPPALLFGNPGYLLALAGVTVPPESYLHFVAIDLARSADGNWWVMSDRTQAPSGAGYALENRTIVGDAVPDLLRTSNVRSLSAFFGSWRDELIRMGVSDDPRIVLLTPGPYNETYFEHAYLARHFGFTLVQGADLAVRDRRVFLKTVDGLQPVDVILRRVDDSYCDPLELRPESYLGVPGLVDAIAAGTVKVANALGSGVVETPAVAAFLPGIAQRLLGETLKIPSVATWWCGQERELSYVLAHLTQLVVKPAFPSRPMEPVFGSQLANAEQQKFVSKVKARPHDYVAQEQVALSTAPVWDGGHLFSRSIVLRTFVLRSGDGWIAMPGGLVRVAGADSSIVSMQRGGHSKDCWVLSADRVDIAPTAFARPHVGEVRRAQGGLPSRVADNLFWLGRYAERSESIARLLRTLIGRVRRAGPNEMECLRRLHKCLESEHSTLNEKRPANSKELEGEIVSLMRDRERPDSLAATLTEAARVGGNVRERLSTDMTRLIGELVESVHVEEYMLFGEYGAVLTGCLELLSAFSGMERENITRGPGWRFMSLGRRLERAIFCVRQLRELANGGLGDEQPAFLEYLLEVADSSMTYRGRYFTLLLPVPVLDTLMLDETNPRSLDFQVDHLLSLYQRLPRTLAADAAAMADALTLLRNLELERIHGGNLEASFAERRRVVRVLEQLDELLPSWADNLSNVYFSHARTLPITIGE